ncbi:hypothetical protein ACJJTC_016661 [Scirpophaga incertulas]
MSLPRTPPKFSSDTNIPTSVESDNRALINTRKRKQPDNNEFQLFEEKFNKQLSLWDQRCREAAKKMEYKYIWVKHGTILARKTDTSPVLAIRYSYDINKIK